MAAITKNYRDANRDAVQRFLPPMSRLVTHRAGDTPELRLGMDIASIYRYVFGYIGLIQRVAPDKRSQNTNTSFMCHVVLKISWVHTRDPAGPRRQCCFARVLAYSSNFATRDYSSENLLSIRDAVSGYVMKPSTEKHSGCNLQYWNFASMDDYLGAY